VSCLYLSDYGPPEPGFDPSANGGRLLAGFEGQSAQLGRATNLAQLEAMERQLQRGQNITWCDQGYGWVYGSGVEAFFSVIMIAAILPYAAWRARRWFLERRGTVTASNPLLELIATGHRRDASRSSIQTGR
jgi:hypothetical protein